jgi:hypothetical protein
MRKRHYLKDINNIKKFLCILLITGLQILAKFIYILNSKDLDIQLRHCFIILISLFFFITFSMIFLNFSLYKHQYISFGFLTICHIIFLIQVFIYSKYNLDILSVFKNFFVCYSYQQLYCISDVLAKKYLNTYMDGLYLFLFKIGITGAIPMLIYDIIAYSSGIDPQYHGIINTVKNGLLLWPFLAYFLLTIMFEINLYLIIYYFSPCHFIIIEILGDFINIIYIFLFENEEEDFKKGEIISFLILYPFLIFSVLVFNEIIILNFFSLSHNTKYYILKRAKKDAITDKLLNIYSENEDSDNDEINEIEKQLTLY